MAEHTHTTYSCDRCKKEIGSERPYRPQNTSIDASFHYVEGPGPSFKWRDLCDGCNSAARAFFLFGPVEMGVTSSERREARVWWAEVGAYVNKEMAEYIMVRTKRIMGSWKP